MVTTVAGDACGEGALPGVEGDKFGTVEDNYFLGFVGGKGRGWRGTFVCFAFIVFFAEGSFALNTISTVWKKRGDREVTSRRMQPSQMKTVRVGCVVQTTLASKCRILSESMSRGASTYQFYSLMSGQRDVDL